MTITCPHCGLVFETRATTNTRCRRCRHVVRVGRSPARAAPEHLELEEAASDDEIAPNPTADEAFAALLTVASVVAGVLTLAVARIVDARRRRHAAREVPPFAPDIP
jgi:hypothetical protein